MDQLFSLLENPFVFIYLVLVAGVQWLSAWWIEKKRGEIEKKRRKAGLTKGILVKQSQRLSELKKETKQQAFTFLLPALVLPVIFIALSGDEWNKGLGAAFLLLLLWVLVNSTDVAKAALGGMAFRIITAFNETFQVGDRVTLRGHSGKVIEIGVFYIKLQTIDDDLISIPSLSLWSENVVSANAGDRASLCVMPFFLSHQVKPNQLQAAENAIWASIQASTYLDPEKPLQIYLSQERSCIQLVAKAYVASTYNEPLFKSDVTHAFLQFASKHNLPLAAPLALFPGDQS